DKSNRMYLFDAESKPDAKDKDSRTAGYVVSYGLGVKGKKHRPTVKDRRRAHIHINYTEKDTMNMAATIVHEATHRFAGTGDFAYSHEAKFKDLQPDEQ